MEFKPLKIRDLLSRLERELKTAEDKRKGLGLKLEPVGPEGTYTLVDLKPLERLPQYKKKPTELCGPCGYGC